MCDKHCEQARFAKVSFLPVVVYPSNPSLLLCSFRIYRRPVYHRLLGNHCKMKFVMFFFPWNNIKYLGGEGGYLRGAFWNGEIKGKIDMRRQDGQMDEPLRQNHYYVLDSTEPFYLKIEQKISKFITEWKISMVMYSHLRRKLASR